MAELAAILVATIALKRVTKITAAAALVYVVGGVRTAFVELAVGDNFYGLLLRLLLGLFFLICRQQILLLGEEITPVLVTLVLAVIIIEVLVDCRTAAVTTWGGGGAGLDRLGARAVIGVLQRAVDDGEAEGDEAETGSDAGTPALLLILHIIN